MEQEKTWTTIISIRYWRYLTHHPIQHCMPEILKETLRQASSDIVKFQSSHYGQLYWNKINQVLYEFKKQQHFTRQVFDVLSFVVRFGIIQRNWFKVMYYFLGGFIHALVYSTYQPPLAQACAQFHHNFIRFICYGKRIIFVVYLLI